MGGACVCSVRWGSLCGHWGVRPLCAHADGGEELCGTPPFLLHGQMLLRTRQGSAEIPSASNWLVARVTHLQTRTFCRS